MAVRLAGDCLCRRWEHVRINMKDVFNMPAVCGGLNYCAHIVHVCESWCLKCIQDVLASLTYYKEDVAEIQRPCLAFCLVSVLPLWLQSFEIGPEHAGVEQRKQRKSAGFGMPDLALVQTFDGWMQREPCVWTVWYLWCFSRKRYRLSCCHPPQWLCRLPSILSHLCFWLCLHFVFFSEPFCTVVCKTLCFSVSVTLQQADRQKPSM